MHQKLNVSLLVSLLFFVSGCSQNVLPKWLQGEWIVDSETTMEYAKLNIPEESHAENLSIRNLELVLPSMREMKLEISGMEILASIHGQRKITKVEVHKIERNMVSLVQPDGIVTDYHKTDEGFWTTTDTGDIKIFFKRKK